MPERLDSSVLGELLGLLAHDLRNPLSALHSNLGFLRSILGAADTDSREAVDDGLISCDGLAHIIDNIDLLGQALQHTEARHERSPVDMTTVIEDVAAAVRSMGQSHGVQIVTSPALGAGTYADTNRELLFRGLGNLVRNSIQHSAPGASVEMSATATPERISIVVRDSGSSLGGLGGTVFTALGQLASKSVPHGRYSRGLGLYSAGIAAAAAGATVRVLPDMAVPAVGNAFELVVPRAK
ncbi:MAG TPA: HAMP domain-containing sensor histidine kinase [Polyangiaceae bacterium]